MRKAIKENNEKLKEELGGFGDGASYKSAAQEFADAWVDAFSESSNTLDALNDQFNDLMKSLVKKQAMQRFAKTFLDPLFKQIDNAILDENGNTRSIDTMIDLLGKAADSAGPTLQGLDEAFKRFMELLKQRGIDITDSSSELSALQQGIQGITENTAEAIESYLNSIRWFLATQQSDVALIRGYLAEHFGNGSNSISDESPMLTELKTQTGYLRELRNTLNSVVAPSGGGMMLKVKGIS